MQQDALDARPATTRDNYRPLAHAATSNNVFLYHQLPGTEPLEREHASKRYINTQGEGCTVATSAAAAFDTRRA
jgi:hypothetical protein